MARWLIKTLSSGVVFIHMYSTEHLYCDNAPIAGYLGLIISVIINLASPLHATSFGFKNWHHFLKIMLAISRTTGPILGLFVLIWMHFSCWIQIWQWKCEILKFCKKFEIVNMFSAFHMCMDRVNHCYHRHRSQWSSWRKLDISSLVESSFNHHPRPFII